MAAKSQFMEFLSISHVLSRIKGHVKTASLFSAQNIDQRVREMAFFSNSSNLQARENLDFLQTTTVGFIAEAAEGNDIDPTSIYDTAIRLLLRDAKLLVEENLKLSVIASLTSSCRPSFTHSCLHSRK